METELVYLQKQSFVMYQNVVEQWAIERSLTFTTIISFKNKLSFVVFKHCQIKKKYIDLFDSGTKRECYNSLEGKMERTQTQQPKEDEVKVCVSKK